MELQILHWFESLHNPFLNPIMYGITMLGEKGIFLILVALAALTVLPKKYRKVGLTMAFALIISLIMCNGVMKNAFARVRPFNVDTSLRVCIIFLLQLMTGHSLQVTHQQLLRQHLPFSCGIKKKVDLLLL